MPSYSGIWSLPAQMQAKASLQWPQGPGAPTSVSATASNAAATVTFVAPSFAGIPTPITGYLATSTPGSFTATGTSSPLTVTGLTNGTAYTFSVQATNGVQYGPAGTSGSVTPINPYFIGTLIPSSGNYYGMNTMFTAADSSGSFLGMGGLTKINDGGTIAFQNTYTWIDANGGFTAAAVDGSGNIYGGGTPGGGLGVSVTKLNSSGNVTWSRRIQYLATDVASITVGNTADVYYIGKKNTGAFFGGSNRTVVAGLTFSGSDIFQKEYGTGPSGFIPAGVGTYNTGSQVFVAGTMYNSYTYERKGFFFAVSKSNGTLAYENNYTANSWFWTLITDPATGTSYIGGESSNSRSLILKLDNYGNKVWGTQLATSHTDCRVSFDNSGNVYALSAGNNTYNNRTLVISKYNSSGTIQWQRNLFVDATQEVSGQAKSISITPSGNIFISCFVYDTPGPTFYNFTALLSPDGSGTGTYVINGKTYVYAAASYTSATDSGTFSSSSHGIVDATRGVTTLTHSVGTNNLVLSTAAL